MPSNHRLSAAAQATRYLARRFSMCCGLLIIYHAAQGQICTASASSLDFGALSPLAGNSATSTSTISINCSGFANALPIRACISIGSGGGGTGLAPRTARLGNTLLQYNLYSDAQASRIWGTRLDANYAPVGVDLGLVQNGPTAAGQRSVTIYGRVPGGQSTLPTGAYLSAFAGAAQIEVAYQQYLLVPPSCAGLSSPNSQPAFSVMAHVIKDCTVSAAPIDFGTVGLLDSPLTASATLSVACTAQSAYSVALSAGGSSGADTSTRRMRLTGGAATVAYQLYRDAGYTTIWGDGSNPGAVVGGIGTGSAQRQLVYARVAPQTTPAAGRYTDTVIVTISY